MGVLKHQEVLKHRNTHDLCMCIDFDKVNFKLINFPLIKWKHIKFCIEFLVAFHQFMFSMKLYIINTLVVLLHCAVSLE